MDNVKDLVLGSICPCLFRRCRLWRPIPNFVKADINGFKIVDSIHFSQSEDVCNILRASGETNYIIDDDILSDNFDGEFQETGSYLSIDNMCYQYGKVDLHPLLNVDMLKRNESRYRVMMSLRGNENLRPPIDINEIVSFVPNLILNNLMNNSKDVKIDLDNDSAISLKTSEYDAIIVFCDASGFTSLADSLCRSKYGAVRLGNCLNKFFDPLIDTIYSWGGEILSFSGDAVTACWLISPTPNGDNSEFDTQRINSSLCALSCCGELHLGLNEFPTPVTDKVLSLHIGVGYGQLKLTPIKVDQDSAISFIITGSSIVEATKGETQASGGETVIGPNVFEILKNVVRTTPMESGWHKVKHITCSLPICPKNKDDKQLNKDILPLLEQLIQPNIFNQVCSGLGSFSNEMRRISAVFVGLRSISILDSKIEDHAAKLHVECKKISSSYGGTLNKINVDDKGVIALLLFGLPPDYRCDYATRAVNAARKIVSKCRASAGVVTGYAWCGLLGNNIRKEYTALGDLINLSARLMELADDGQVLVDRVTFKRVKKIPLVLSAHKKVKGKTGNFDIYQVCNKYELNSQILFKKTKMTNYIPNFVGKLINWKNWPFRQNISKILDPLILKGGIKNILATKGEGLVEAILLSTYYFGTKNWMALRVENGNWKGLIDKILSTDKISTAKQLLAPRFHSKLGALFDSSFFDKDTTMLKRFSFGLDLESARKVWGSPYEVLIEIFRGYAKLFGSAGIVIIVEAFKDDPMLEDMIKVVLSDSNRIKKVAILTLGTKRIKNVPTSVIGTLSREESRNLTAHILRQPIDSANIDLLSEYVYRITGGASRYLSQTIKLLITKGIIKWEGMNYSNRSENGNDHSKDSDNGMCDDESSSDSDSDSDFSVSIASGDEFSEEDLESINGDDLMLNIEEYGGIVLDESLDTAPIIESMWTEAIKIVDNLPEDLLKGALSIVKSTGNFSSESVEPNILESLEMEGVIRIIKETGGNMSENISYTLTNDAIRRVLTEKYISRTYNQTL
ncbi:Adenylate cyclase type 10 [Babesia microti strain RI]|uniref:Adenylate cyclase type 10 n=1 Tax=Babesia microti (strain RI) TaxID=1133968 RepID=I7J954_BABMR|nr:Adenylate cyclase type 10 [Babesia microti strain RI]CCF75713.1 Adenylate cyclase type 10 [Babesia microti strain RI]|eukprot:XP_012650121.1 Adenylate cyclase type 10 [Babesia microti strain RI]